MTSPEVSADLVKNFTKSSGRVYDFKKLAAAGGHTGR